MMAEASRYNLSGHRIPPIPPEEASFSGCSGQTRTQLEKSHGHGNNAGGKATPSWITPSNDVAVASPIIGNEDSWPVLSESTRHSPKSTVDSPKSIFDASISNCQGHLISKSFKNRNHNHPDTNQNSKFTSNQTKMQSRQRWSKRGMGVDKHPPPTPPPYPIYEVPYSALPPAMPGPFFITPAYDGNNWERRPVGGFAPQPSTMNDQPFPMNSYLRDNYGGRPRGDGPHKNSHGPRRDQHRDRNASRRGFARPLRSPPPAPPFFPLHSLRSFADPIGSDMASQYINFPLAPTEFFMPFAPPPPPIFFHAVNPGLPSELIKQIDHYFSDDNLAKDTFLRSKMDGEGWVDIAVIGGFPLVRQMTNNLQLILDSLRASTVVEVQGSHIRRRNEWRKWILSLPRSSTGTSSLTSVGSAENMLTKSLENITLGDETNPTKL